MTRRCAKKVMLEDVVAFLRKASAKDPEVVERLFCLRVPCSYRMTEDPKMVVAHNTEFYQIGMVGLLEMLNSLFVDDDGRCIRPVVDRRGHCVDFKIVKPCGDMLVDEHGQCSAS